jgi:hypothetical protein
MLRQREPKTLQEYVIEKRQGRDGFAAECSSDYLTQLAVGHLLSLSPSTGVTPMNTPKGLLSEFP